MKSAHLLTPEEILSLKAIRKRGKVGSGDYSTINEIYKRMSPGYVVCDTCIDTLAAETKSLIAYAEKQIGGSILNYDPESPDRDIDPGLPVTIHIDELPDLPKDKGNFSKTIVIPAAYFQAIEPTGDDTTPLTADQVSAMNSDAIIAYVKKLTDVELEEADHAELVETALEVLGLKVEPKKIALPKNGFSGLGKDDLIAYVIQEKGVTLDGSLSRPKLLKAAAEILNPKGSSNVPK